MISMFDRESDVLRSIGNRADTNNIHQVVIVDGMGLPETISDALLKSRRSMELVHPEARYKLWSGNDLRAFIGQHFNKDVLNAFDTIKPYAFKNDLARLCLLYMTGGLYCDLAISIVENIAPVTNAEIVAFWDLDSSWNRPDAIYNGIIWARRGSPILKSYIQDIVHSVKVGRYGFNALCATSPYAFGRVARKSAWPLLRFASDGRFVLGHMVRSNDLHKSLEFFLGGTLVAHRLNKEGGDMSFSGLAGTNNYNQIWNAGQMYGEMRETARVDRKNSRLSRAGRSTTFRLRIDLPFHVAPGHHHFMMICEVEQPVFVKCLARITSEESNIIYEQFIEQPIAKHIEFFGVSFHTMNAFSKISIQIEGNEDILRMVREIKHAIF